MTETIQTNLGDLISTFYAEFLDEYGDPDVAAVAAAATINDLFVEGAFANTASAEAETVSSEAA
jgi:hypothetical protein